MTNDIEQFTAPGKYVVDKFFEEIEAISHCSKNIHTYNLSEKLKNHAHQLKQLYNRMRK